MERRHAFHDYLAVRLWTAAAALLATVCLALMPGTSGPAAIALMGVCLGVENVSDTYYGLMQRRERMDQIAWSMMARGALAVAVVGPALWLTHNLIAALAALALARVVVLVAYDRPRGLAGERVGVAFPPGRLAILRSALPLGVVLMLASLTVNVPRYAIERYLGTRELGAFAAVASFIAAGGAVVGALGQSAMPRLAICYSAGDLKRFRELALKLCALSLALGVAGVVGAAVAGRWVLGIAYRPEYAAYSGLLVAVMAAGVPRYLAIMLGYVLTSARSFGPQMPLLVAVMTAAALASWRLVPAMGLGGAAVAIAVAACVQIGGAMLILGRAMRRA
jgi:O-antigen/teichoic acid export membrane protein